MTLEKMDRIVKWVTIAAGILYILAIVIVLVSCSPVPAQPVATVTPSPTATPTPSPTACPVYQVAADALEVRNGPGEAYSHETYLTRGATVTVYQTAQAGPEFCTTWAAITPSLTRWVCLKYLKGQ